MSPREHALLVYYTEKCEYLCQWLKYLQHFKAVVGVHTLIAHSGDNWQTLTNVMEKKGTMAAHTLELPSPDVRRRNQKQTIPDFFMPGI